MDSQHYRSYPRLNISSEVQHIQAQLGKNNHHRTHESYFTQLSLWQKQHL